MDFQKINKEKIILVLLILISFIVNLSFMFSYSVISWDESVYINLGYDLSRNFLDYSVENNGWSDYIPSVGDPNYSWPKIGFRAPLLPYTLAILNLLSLASLVTFFIPFIGAINVALTYILGKNLFNKEVGIISAIFLLLIPLNIMVNSKTLTGTYVTFYLLLTLISFWKGFENNEEKYKLIFGFLFGLALLARYTALWFIPIFFFYFLLRKRSFKFILDYSLWRSILVFFITLSPWLFYGFKEYNNILGAFFHGGKAASYWGGIQPFYFYISNLFSSCSIIWILVLLYLFKTLLKKKVMCPENLFLIMWASIFLLIASFMPHKEERFIAPILPALCILSGVFVNSLKKYKKIIILLIISFLTISTVLTYTFEKERSFSEENICFLELMEYLNDVPFELRVITDESSLVYYYTKRHTNFYPSSLSALGLKPILDETYGGKLYALYFEQQNREDKSKKIFDENWENIFSCSNNLGRIYSFDYPIDY